MPFAHLVEELSDDARFVVRCIDSRASKSKTLETLVVDPLRALGEVLSSLPTHDVVSLHGSVRRMLVFGSVLAVMSAMIRKPLVLRVFGGNLDLIHAGANPIERFLFTTMFRASIVLLETKHLITYFRSAFPCAEIVWFPNGRPLFTAESENEGAPEEASGNSALRLIFLGEVKPSKGIGVLIEAARLLGDRPDLHIDVYGPMLEGLSPNDFNSVPLIRYRGTIDNARVSSLLRAYHALVLPTIHPGEGHPGAVIEAFMAGIPVISTRWRSVPEVVKHERNGLLVEPRDARELARALERLIEDPSCLRRLARGAAESAPAYASIHWNGEVFPALCLRVLSDPSFGDSSDSCHRDIW